MIQQDLLNQAQEVYQKNFALTTTFERAIFFSWGCSIGDCGFCYMSTQPKDKPLTETKRSTASILAEFMLAKALGWDIGFFTGGIGVLLPLELEEMLKMITEILEDKIWLSVGPLSQKILERYQPYIKGIVGSTETINPILHKKVCPSKPLAPYENMFEAAQHLGIPSAMTFIVGMGEIHDDFLLLKAFIEKYHISKIHVYGLIPQKETMFEHSKRPTKEEQAWWIANLRITFPTLDIQCGIWDDRIDYVSYLLHAGANTLSKLQALKYFGTSKAHEIKAEAQKAGRTFRGTLTTFPHVDWNAELERLTIPEKLKKEIYLKLQQYLKHMQH